MRLILASSSPYRREMLQRLALNFDIIAPNIDETPLSGELPDALALRLAQEKALAIAQQQADAVVIGCDQVATLGHLPIGKAGSHDKAFAQLQQLSGQTIVFHSALCVVYRDTILIDSVPTHCRFRTLSDDEITYYLHHDQPYDTAGSAKAESLGIALMDSMQSDDPTAIIGLPLIRLNQFLRQVGINPLNPTR